MRERIARALPWITGTLLFIQLLSLRIGIFNRFFFDALHEDVQGIDYYSLPGAFVNLLAHRSAYDTFGAPTYGPHFTWYLAHPLLAVVLGSFLSLFEPTTGYGVYTMLSLGMMAACAWLLARETEDRLTRNVIWFLLLTAFPTYWMLFVGNVQALLVLALGLLLAGMLRLRNGNSYQAYILAGLLLSLFTKPVVFLALPLLLMLRETHRSALRAIAIYAVVSIAFLIVPTLNPEAIGLHQVASLAMHPSVVRDTMNIYQLGMHLTPPMRDNSIHWFNLVAQSQTRLLHIDVYSLPVFLDTLFHAHTPNWLYALPSIAVLALSVWVARIKESAARNTSALLLIMAASLAFFLSYPTVWEYQYTIVLPVAAALLLMKNVPAKKGLSALAACAWLPSLYFTQASLPPLESNFTLIRIDRVVPVTVLFVWMLVAAYQSTKKTQKQ